MGFLLAVLPLPAFRNNSFPALTETAALFRSARDRNTASDSCDWSMGGTAIASVSTTLAVSLLRAAIVSTICPSVVSCHDCSRREFSVPRKSALRP